MNPPWWLLQSPPAPAAFNMAVDEALWRTAAGRARPLLRIYSWSEPSVTLGYFQKFPAHLANRYRIVRRPTGGGIVYHTDDTTYTVVVPPGHPLHTMPAEDAYLLLHRAVAAALDQKTQISNLKSTPRGTYECFQRPVVGDLLSENGVKLAGGAQRRGRHGLLHQGSIAVRLSVAQLMRGFRAVFGAEFADYELTPEEAVLAERLAREKYATERWNRKLA